jgi:hypothetical protein
MTTKPTISQVRFAVDGSDTDSAQIGSGPSSGLRDSGYLLDAVPTHNDIDYLFNRYYRWFQFIDEVFKVAGTAVGDFKIGGSGSFGGVLTPSGGIAAFTAIGLITAAAGIAVGGQALTVASTAFTADNTTEIFTATGIDLQTGDGPLRVSTTTTLPSGLTAGTDYFAIRLTANTFKLATTFANALAGTNLLIASNGTGTHNIVSFGATRPSDATVSRNLAVHGNLTVDGNISGNVVRSSWTETFFPILISTVPFDASTQHADGSGTTAGGYTSNAGSDGIAYGYTLIPVAAGDRITAVRFWACGNGTADATIAVWTAPSYDQINTFSGGNTQLGLTIDNNRADTWSIVTVGLVAGFTAHTITSGSYVAVFWTPNAAGYRVGPIEVTFDRPAV